MDGIIRRLKAGLRRSGTGRSSSRGSSRSITRLHRTHTVMMAGVGVESRRRAEMMGTADRTKLDQRLERTIDGGA